MEKLIFFMYLKHDLMCFNHFLTWLLCYCCLSPHIHMLIYHISYIYILHNSWIRLSDNVICVILLINWLISCFFFYPSLKLFVWLLVIGWMLCIFSLTLHWKIAVIYNIYVCVYIYSFFIFVCVVQNQFYAVGWFLLFGSLC